MKKEPDPRLDVQIMARTTVQIAMVVNPRGTNERTDFSMGAGCLTCAIALFERAGVKPEEMLCILKDSLEVAGKAKA